MDHQVFSRGMLILSAAYPDYLLKEETTELYWEFLQHLDSRAFEMAIKRHISKHKWFPKVNELLEAIESAGPSPIDAWQSLLAAAETGKMPELDYPTLRGMKAAGGWEAIQYMPLDDLKFKFKDFKEAYLDAVQQEKSSKDLLGGAPLPQIEGK
jgi:hypothetical protein